MSDVRVLGSREIADARTAVIVPARNEAAGIAATLGALAIQDSVRRPVVCLCVNNTSDSTAEIAEEVARRTRMSLVLIRTTIRHGGVGQARRIGHDVVRLLCPELRNLLSTDADCIAAPGWVRAMEDALGAAPAVLGRIEADAAGLERFPPAFHARARIEAAYLRLSLQFERLLHPRGAEAIGLNTAGGANLGLRTGVYDRIGGYRPLCCGEDRDLVDRIIAAGYQPVRANRAIVVASVRMVGRAPGGMAEAIACRLLGDEDVLDSALAPFDTMLARHAGSPTSACASGRITASDAVRDMPVLAACLARLRRIDGIGARQAVLATLHADRLTSRPGAGSAENTRVRSAARQVA